MRMITSDAHEPRSIDIDGDGKSSPMEYICYVIILGIVGIFFYGQI